MTEIGITAQPNTAAAGEGHTFLAGGGELGALIRAKDWAATTLGAPASWPQSLKTAVRIVLTSRQPMFVWWGEHLINIHNDAYRAILGGKHPTALGEPAAEIWREIWHQIGPRAAHAISRNEGTYDKALLLMMERNGYTEETYYTFSYSPVPDDDGGTGGIICANTDYTAQIIGERQLGLLRDLAAGTAEARTIETAARLAATSLAGNPRDLPFALIYLADPERKRLTLCASSGISGSGAAAVPAEVRSDDPAPWPLWHAVSSLAAVLIPEVPQALAAALDANPWDRPPTQLVVLPLAASGQSGAAGVLVVGLNPYRLYDDTYRGFLGLVAGQIAAAITHAHAYDEERRRAEALTAIDRAKTAFFSNVSHEFRTPLTLLLGPIEDALAEAAIAPPEVQRERLDIAHRNALRLLRLVNSLLDFSRIEAGRMSACFAPTDLAALTRDLAGVFRSAIERASLTLEVDCPPLAELVYVDRDMWEKIVLNLLSNAFKFTFEGSIRVALRAVEWTAVLTVQDSGTGIPPAELPRLFDRFHRVDRAQGRTHEGSGIGLAMVQELARLHGGTVSVESEFRHGTIFTVTIPLGHAHLPPEQISAQAVASAPSGRLWVEEALRWLPETATHDTAAPANPAVPRERILIVDDNADMRDYMRRLLADRHDVRTAADGHAALAAIRAERPDLVISDVMMPVLDGFGLLTQLRQDPALADLPVVLLSARAGEEASVEGLQGGADDYLTKPFSARELLARVASILALVRARRHAAARDRALHETGERFRIALQNAPVIVYTCDLDLRYTWVTNPVRGFQAEDMIGRTDEEIRAGEDVSAFTELKLAALQSGTPMHRTIRSTVRGRPMMFDMTAEPLRNAEGAIVGLTVAAVDLTAGLETEAELRRLNETLEARVRAEVAAREEAQARLAQAQRMEALGQLAGGVAHDFNNVLQGLAGAIQIIRKRAGNAEAVTRLAGMMAESAERGAAITRRLLAFARRVELRAEAIDGTGLLADLHEMLIHTLGRGIAVIIAVEPELPPLWADRGQLETVLVNLATNARDAMPEGGTLTLRAVAKQVGEAHPAELAAGLYVQLSVIDTGIGMDAATQARAAEPFFTTKPVGQGTGLGLAMARGFAEQSGGALTIDSACGRGTTITLWLPQADSQLAVAPREPAADTLPAPAATVLLVDDEMLVRRVLAEQLADAGFIVQQADGGAMALAMLADAAVPDVLVTDLAMPGMDGVALIRAVQDRYPRLPAVLLTGYAGLGAATAAGAAIDGTFDLLRKPVSATQLADRIATLLQGGMAPPAARVATLSR